MEAFIWVSSAEILTSENTQADDSYTLANEIWKISNNDE